MKKHFYLYPHEKRILSLVASVMLCMLSALAGAAFVIRNAQMRYDPSVHLVEMDFGGILQFTYVDKNTDGSCVEAMITRGGTLR